MRILIINGPNLHNIGVREPAVYGNRSFADYFRSLQAAFPDDELEYFQSFDESEITMKIQNAQKFFQGIVLNAGAYSHTSVAVRDAVAAINLPVVMVHISNVYARSQFRHENIIAPVCKGIITGFGLLSYTLAVEALKH